MARVPLYNGGNFTPAPTGARVPLPEPLQAGGGAAAWGQALSGVSKTLQIMGEKKAEADDTRQLIEAEGLMRSEAMDFQKFQQTADEGEWLDNWQQRQGKLQKSFDEMQLTGGARLRLSQSFGRWGDNQAIEIQGAAFKQSVGRAKQAVLNRADEAAASGDFQGIHSALSLLPQDFTTPEERESIRLTLDEKARSVARQQEQMAADTIIKNRGLAGVKEANAIYDDSPHWTPAEKANLKAGTERAAEFENLRVLANDDPRRAAELAVEGEKSGRITAPQRVEIVNASESRLDGMRSDSLKAFTQEIKMGVANKEEIAGRIMDDSSLTEQDKASLGMYLDIGPVNDPEAYAGLWTAAKTFEGQEGTPAYSQLVSRIDMALDGEQKSSVLAQLGSTVKGPKDGQTRAFNEVYSLAADDLKNGAFGDFLGRLEDPKTIPPANIRAEIRTLRDKLIADAGDGEQAKLQADPKRMEFWERRAREAWHSSSTDKNKADFASFAVEDEAKKRQATARLMDVTANLERWRADNPKATPTEFRSYYESLLSKQRAASGYISPLLPSLEVPKTDLNSLLQRNAKDSRK